MAMTAGAVAVVMGAGTTAGRVVSLALAGEVALVYCADLRSSAAAATAAAIVAGGGRALSQSVDVTERDEVDALFDRVVAGHGRVDVVCNVVTARAQRSLLELSEDSVERTVLASIRGAFFTCQAAGRVMAARGGGVIVNVMGPDVGGGAVANAAIAAAATELSRELAAAGVEVVVVDGDLDNGAAGAAVARLAADGSRPQAATREATTPSR